MHCRRRVITDVEDAGVGAGRGDLVDSVEHVVGERFLRSGEQIVGLVHGARCDNCRCHLWVGADERHSHVCEPHARAVVLCLFGHVPGPHIFQPNEIFASECELYFPVSSPYDSGLQVRTLIPYFSATGRISRSVPRARIEYDGCSVRSCLDQIGFSVLVSNEAGCVSEVSRKNDFVRCRRGFSSPHNIWDAVDVRWQTEQ